MSFFSKVRETLRSKPGDKRDEFCVHLQSLGIDVQMTPRGRAEEKIYAGPRRSMGVIDIIGGPIRWVNVTQATRAVGGAPDEDDMPDYLVYGVPDARVGPGFPKVRVKAMTVKVSFLQSFFRSGWCKYEALGSRGPGRSDMELWGFRPVIGVRWEGDDSGLGIVQHLTQDVSVGSAIADGNSWGLISGVNPRDGVVEIRAYPDGWILTTKDALQPTRQEWDSYQSIASHLLGTPILPNT